MTNEESMLKDIYEHERQKAMVEHKCEQIIKFDFTASEFAKQLLKIMGVEI